MRLVKYKLQFILVMLFTVASLGVMSETLYLAGQSTATMKIDDVLYTTYISHSKINRKTKWWKGGGKPPINKPKAYNLALAKLISQFPSIVWKEKKTSLEYTSAKKGFYAVGFVDSNNKSLGVVLYVLMTGEVSKIEESEPLRNKKYTVTNKHIGTSYSSSKDAGEIAYKKATDEAKKMCTNRGGVIDLKPGSLNMPFFRKDNERTYTATISVKYACRN